MLSKTALLVCLIGASSLAVASAQDSNLNGICGRQEDDPTVCETKYRGTLCTSVFGSANSKCTVTNPYTYTCGGVNYGNCPTRGGWPVTPTEDGVQTFPAGTICLFTTNSTCIPKQSGNGTSSSSNNTGGGVDCVGYPLNSDSGTTTVNGIWQCFASSELACAGGSADLPIKSPCRNCISNNGTYELCNGRGTCVPNSFDGEGKSYACRCDAGWGGSLCTNATDNACDIFDGCGANGKCGSDSRCVCNTGWTGNKCSKCTADSVCQSVNKEATCVVSSGTCACKNSNTTAYSGDACTTTRDLQQSGTEGKKASEAVGSSVPFTALAVALAAVCSALMK